MKTDVLIDIFSNSHTLPSAKATSDAALSRTIVDVCAKQTGMRVDGRADDVS